MRKGEKLIKYLSDAMPIFDGYEVVLRDHRIVQVIRNMTDEKFNEILKDDY